MTPRRAAYLCWLIALAAGTAYALGAVRAGLGGVAVGGGFAWVVLLTLIISLPVVIPLARRGRSPDGGDGPPGGEAVTDAGRAGTKGG